MKSSLLCGVGALGQAALRWNKSASGVLRGDVASQTKRGGLCSQGACHVLETQMLVLDGEMLAHWHTWRIKSN